MAQRELFLFAGCASAPHGPDRVQHVLRGELAGARRLHVARRATAEVATLVEDGGAARTVNRAVDTASAEQCGVRRVDDRVDLLFRDVAEDELDHRPAGAVRKNAGGRFARDGPGRGTRPR